MPRHPLLPALPTTALLATALLLPALPVSATVISTRTQVFEYTVSETGPVIVAVFGSPTYFAATAFGQVQVSTHVVGAYADGARDGAGLTVGTALVRGSLIRTDQTSNPVTAAGGSAAFVGPGTTPGIVRIGKLAVENSTNATANIVSFSSGGTFPDPGGEVPVSSELRMTGLDTGTNGVSFNASSTALLNGAPKINLAASAATAGRAATGTDSGFGAEDCEEIPGGCTGLNHSLSTSISPLDLAAGLVRNELGGDQLQSGDQVTALYALASDTKTFDCLFIGCTAQNFSFGFSTQGLGDSFVFAIVQIVSTVDAPGGPGGDPGSDSGQAIPEPATLALLGMGLAGLAAARRRHK